MTADLLLCWYAMGWFARGISFTFDDPKYNASLTLCFILPPLVILVVLCDAYENRKEQYLWRRPK